MFFLNVLVSGLLAGLMYAMVAIGFVLIYKASGVFNFAQGTMVFFAALTFVVLNERGLPFWAALPITVLVMIIGAVLIEWLVLRPLVNRSPNTLFMATLGLSFVIEGLAQALFGSDVHELDLGIDDTPLDLFGLQISAFDIFASTISIVMVAVLAALFNKTRMGMSVGIRLPHIWRIVWSVSGFVALVAGLLWGARQGVQFSLSLVVLKAMPVLIIGGFSSIPGAIVGGLLVGATENLADIYIGPLVHGSVSNWFAYILAIGFLLIRPSGLFGEEQIARV
jgi:branched-chain amino acid transport system permease protein